jgi:hypothetical protein
MQQFKIKQDRFKEIRKQILVKTIPISLLAGGVGVSIGMNNQQSTIDVLPVVIPVILATMVFAIFISIKRQKKIFESYTLAISEDAIVRKQTNTPTITIPFNRDYESKF